MRVFCLIKIMVFVLFHQSLCLGKSTDKNKMNLDEYILKPQAFEETKLIDQVEYLRFFSQLIYEIETIQKAPQDQLKLNKLENKKRKNAASETIKDFEFWLQKMLGEKSYAQAGTTPASSCDYDRDRTGKACVVAGHQSYFVEQTLNGMARQMCQIPLEAGGCGEGKVGCDTFGLEAIFSALDPYSSNSEKVRPICVTVEPRNELAARCRQAFVQWQSIHFKKLGNLKTGTQLVNWTPTQQKNYYSRYFLAYSFLEKNIDCLQDKVQRCRQINDFSWGTKGNGVNWSYDARSNTSYGTIPGAKGYVSFQGKLREGGSFSGQKVDPDFQRSECRQILAAEAEIKLAWDKIPHSTKNWVRANNMALIRSSPYSTREQTKGSI